MEPISPTSTSRTSSRSSDSHNSHSPEPPSKDPLGSKVPKWIPDKAAQNCQVCHKAFRLRRRKHHCRACGSVVCGTCSSRKMRLEYSKSNQELRICDHCFPKLKARVKEESKKTLEKMDEVEKQITAYRAEEEENRRSILDSLENPRDFLDPEASESDRSDGDDELIESPDTPADSQGDNKNGVQSDSSHSNVSNRGVNSQDLELRKRKTLSSAKTGDVRAINETGKDRKRKPLPVLASKDKNEKKTLPVGYELSRIAFFRLFGLVHLCAFLVAFQQIPALIGKNGLQPAYLYLESLQNTHRENIKTTIPSLLWLVSGNELQSSDRVLLLMSGLGAVLSFIIMIMGSANMIFCFTLYILQLSLHSAGQVFWGYGWEIQLLETTFLAMFLCPFWSLKRISRQSPTPLAIIILLRWLLFRVMMGAGLIKIRGDQCWQNLTCLNYHYETQPIPSPLSWYLHQLPPQVQAASVGLNHFVELVLPFFLFSPWRQLRHFCGVCQIGFQSLLILSGNLSFLNYLSILPALATFDDKFFAWPIFFPFKTVHSVINNPPSAHPPGIMQKFRTFVNAVVILLVIYLSYNPVSNLLSMKQAMNMSFDRLHLVNSYGAFGSVSEQRIEVVIRGSNDKKTWYEYEFKCKPGNVSRAPCFISPYHFRIDWQMWFIPLQRETQDTPLWFKHFLAKLLIGDELALGLLESSPFPPENPPKYIRADYYRYAFTKDVSDKDWWHRDYVSPVLEATTESAFFKSLAKHYQLELPTRLSKSTSRLPPG